MEYYPKRFIIYRNRVKNMELIIKHFRDLSADELLDICKVRVSVFVVEQNCPYQEIDEADRSAYHIYMKNEEGICAYLRVLPKGVIFDDVSIGRVLTVKRRCGLGSKILSVGINTAKEKFNATRIVIGAQVYARGLYEKAGFVQSSDEYLEDGIPHIHMILTLK